MGDGRKSYENEEWYQKWLRRQKNKPRQIIEIGNDRPPEPEKQEEPKKEEPKTEETAAAERRKSYENEEWYQKWLRRQKNKPRQIIEIGVDKPPESEASQEQPMQEGKEDE